MKKFSKKKDLSKKLTRLRRKEKICNKVRSMFAKWPKDMSMTSYIASVSAAVGGLVGFFWGGPKLSNKMYYDKVEEVTPQISDEILRITQEKAVNFNEKFGESIAIPTTNNVEISDLGKTISSDAVESVRSSVADLINDKMLNIQAGGVSGEVHSLFSHGTITGIDGEILVKPGFENYIIERGQYLQNELGTSLNNDISNIVSNAIPESYDTFGPLIGLGLGLIPAAVIMGAPIMGHLGFNVSSDMRKKYKDKADRLERRIEYLKSEENSEELNI